MNVCIGFIRFAWKEMYCKYIGKENNLLKSNEVNL